MLATVNWREYRVRAFPFLEAAVLVDGSGLG